MIAFFAPVDAHLSNDRPSHEINPTKDRGKIYWSYIGRQSLSELPGQSVFISYDLGPFFRRLCARNLLLAKLLVAIYVSYSHSKLKNESYSGHRWSGGTLSCSGVFAQRS